MTAHLIGLDVGTSTIKAVRFDLEGFEIASAARSVEVLAPQPGWAEQDMEAVWTAAQETIREVLDGTAAAEQIAAVGIAGQGDGAWMIDVEGRPVGPAPLWNDGRASKAVHRWESSGRLARLWERGGTALWPGTQAALLAWFADNEPELLEEVTTVFCSKDWVRYRLTGTIGTDETDGSIPFMDLASRRLDAGQLDILGLSGLADRLPSVQRSHDVVGGVTRAAADATGLRPGTPVVAGLLDVAANAVGAGAIDGGQAIVTLGTTALSAIVLDVPAFAADGIGASTCHAPAQRWLRVLGTMAGTTNLDWYLATAGEVLGHEAARDERDVFSLLEETIGQAAPGAGGVIYHPYLQGERVPFVAPEARAAFTGLSSATSRADLARAVSEGVAFAVRHGFDAVDASVTDVRLTGGGNRSLAWSQILADVTGATMKVPCGDQIGALGAAMVAGIGIGEYPDYAAAVERCVRLERVHEPAPSLRALYDDRYGLYLELVDAMRPFWSHHAGSA
jgi:sugar (pentulose or hexulose) kinase